MGFENCYCGQFVINDERYNMSLKQTGESEHSGRCPDSSSLFSVCYPGYCSHGTRHFPVNNFGQFRSNGKHAQVFEC